MRITNKYLIDQSLFRLQSRLSSFELDSGTNFTTVVANSEIVLLGQASTWDNIFDPYSNADAIDSHWSFPVCTGRRR